MINPIYIKQVELLLQILPYIAKENCLALKGGTAINMFVRDLPRLSVDIDLTYLPFDDRDEALNNISNALLRIKEHLYATMPELTFSQQTQTETNETKLICQRHNTQVKIEVNTVMRGHIFPAKLLPVRDIVQSQFGKFAAIQVLSTAELYGGKICAALDRQHPRDLFDMHYLFKQEGFSEEIKIAFIAFLLSHNRPINELLNPNFLDLEETFETQFAGMSEHKFIYNDYRETRERLVQIIFKNFTEEDKRFLISFKKGNPDWQVSPIDKIKDLPAVKWKLLNIQKLLESDSNKHKKQLEALESLLLPS